MTTLKDGSMSSEVGIFPSHCTMLNSNECHSEGGGCSCTIPCEGSVVNPEGAGVRRVLNGDKATSEWRVF